MSNQMRVNRHTSNLVVWVLVLSLIPKQSCGQMTASLRNATLHGHNRQRSTLTQCSNMIRMSYDMDLERIAQAHVNGQSRESFKSNDNRSLQFADLGGSGYVGENWYPGSPVDAVLRWTTSRFTASPGGKRCSEYENYIATHIGAGASHLCDGGPVDHFVQVMWAKTVQIGCGYTASAGTVCNYSPGRHAGSGFLVGKIGSACGECDSKYYKCVDNMCTTNSTSEVLLEALGAGPVISVDKSNESQQDRRSDAAPTTLEPSAPPEIDTSTDNNVNNETVDREGDAGRYIFIFAIIAGMVWSFAICTTKKQATNRINLEL